MPSQVIRALIISADRFEDSELSEPLCRLQTKGVVVDLAAPRRGLITGKHGYTIEAGLALEEVRTQHYQLLLVPGGRAPAELQKNPLAVSIAGDFLAAGKPVAAICHGPQLLIPTGLLAGRAATCYGGMAAELKAAGVDYRDRAVVVDGNLITSRRPADLPAFMKAIFALLGLS